MWFTHRYRDFVSHGGTCLYVLPHSVTYLFVSAYAYVWYIYMYIFYWPYLCPAIHICIPVLSVLMSQTVGACALSRIVINVYITPIESRNDTMCGSNNHDVNFVRNVYVNFLSSANQEDVLPET